MITSKNRNSSWRSTRRRASSGSDDYFSGGGGSQDVGQDVEQQNLEEEIKKETDPQELHAALEKYWNLIKPSDKKAVEKNEVEELARDVLSRIESKDPRFKMGLVFGGSMYENIKMNYAKTSRGSEWYDYDLTYHVTLPLAQLAIEEEELEAEDTACDGFTKYPLKSDVAETWKDLADCSGKLLDPRKILDTFDDLFSKSIKEMNETEECRYKSRLSSYHGELEVGNVTGKETLCVVKFTPVIELKKLPERVAAEWESRKNKAWPGDELATKVQQNLIYLVPTFGREDGLLWRYTCTQGLAQLFTERASALPNDCITKVIGILRGFLNDIPEDWTWHELLKPWHMNSVMLYEFEEHPETEKWQISKLGERVLSVMTRLKNCLQEGNCMDYFIKDKNLMSSAEMENDDVKDIRSGVNKFIDDPFKLVTTLIEEYEFRATSNKVFEEIEEFLSNSMAIIKASMENRPSVTSQKAKSEDKRKVERQKGKSKERATGKNRKSVQQQSKTFNEEKAVFVLPEIFITQIEDVLDKSRLKSWRSHCKRSEVKERYFCNMILELEEDCRLREDDTLRKLYTISDQVRDIPCIFNAIIWDGEDPQQFCKQSLEICCNTNQEMFNLITRSLPYYQCVTFSGNIDVSCTDAMLNEIEVASKTKEFCVERLSIDNSAVLSEGAYIYCAHIIPFVKSVDINFESIPKIFTDTLMSVCKSLDFDVRTREINITIHGKKRDVGDIVKFFPLVERVRVIGKYGAELQFSLDSIVSFAIATAETSDRGAREEREFPLKRMLLSDCTVDPQGVGWELMKVLSFVEKVNLDRTKLSCDDVEAMSRYISELKRHGDQELVLKELVWNYGSVVGNVKLADLMKLSSFVENVKMSSGKHDCYSTQEMSKTLVEIVDENRTQVSLKKLIVRSDEKAEERGDVGLGADIANLIALIENLELNITGFKCEDWAEMARVMSEMIHEDKDRFCIKKLKLKYSEDEVMGKDIIRIAALIEDVDLDGRFFEANELKEMCAVLSELLDQGEEHVRLKKLQLHGYLGDERVGREIINLVSLIEHVDLSEIRFKAADFQDMSLALSQLKKSDENRVRIRKLDLSWGREEGSGTSIANMIPLIQTVDLHCEGIQTSELQDMISAMLNLLKQPKDGVCLKKFGLWGYCRGPNISVTHLTNLMALLEEAYFGIDFEGDEFRQMSARLSRLIVERPDLVKIKKLWFYACDLKEKGLKIIELLSLVENVELRHCKLKKYDLQQMASILTKKLKSKKDQVRIKQLSLRDCDLERKEYGEHLIKLIRNLETVDLQLNDLLPADLMKIANFFEDLSGTNPRRQKHRTKSLVLSVFKEIKAEHARIAFNAKEVHVYPNQVAMRLLKEVAELSTEYGLQGGQCRLKMLKVVTTENEPLTQELVNLANEIGVIISALDKKQCEWCHVVDWIDKRDWNAPDISGGCKFIINGISEEVQEISDGYVSLCVSKELTEDINWKVSRGSCHIDLAVGEAVLSDVISIGPEGKSFDKAATLKIPYNIYEVPELTEVVCEYLDLESDKWERVAAVFTRDDNGIRYATVNIHVATKYMISLRLKKHIARIRQREITISLFGGRQDIDVSFFAGTFGDESQDCCFKVNRFSAQALQQLKRLGFTISPMLQFEMVGAQPKKPIEVKLPVENVSSNAEQLVILCWNGTELTDVTWEMKPTLLDNAVLCEINQACSILAILLETHAQRRGDTLSKDILKYMQPQLEMRFYLYVKDVHDPDYCIACSRVEDRSIVDDKLRPMGYEMVTDCPAINGVFENTDMRIGIEGGVVEKNSRGPLKLRLKDGKCCFTEKFHLKKSADADNSCITFTNESNGIKYGSLSFTWPLVKGPASIATVEPINELEHARFLGMRLENCFLEELNFHDDTVFNNLRSLGLRKKQTQNIRSMLRAQDDSMEGNFMVEKVAWKEITDAFVKGQLDEKRFENFGKLDPQRMRENVLEVLRFLRKPWQEGDETQSKCIAKLSECKIFEQYDITTVFGRCLGLRQREIDAVEKETKLACLQDQFIITRGNHCCKLMLELAMKKRGGRKMLEIVKSLLKTKLHFKTFQPETRKDLLVQMVLDSFGKVIENQVVNKDNH